MVKRVRLRPVGEQHPRGTRVTVTYDRTRRGTIVASGPEVSEVRWDDGGARGRGRTAFISNVVLRTVMED